MKNGNHEIAQRTKKTIQEALKGKKEKGAMKF